MQQCVWDVVCVAALDAMEEGRRHAKGLRARQPPAAQAEVLARSSAVAAAGFWGRLASFVALRSTPKHGGWEGVPLDHPFIGVTHDGTFRMVLNRP